MKKFEHRILDLVREAEQEPTNPNIPIEIEKHHRQRLKEIREYLEKDT